MTSFTRESRVINAGEYVLTFPDGRLVGEGELDTWLEEINAREDFTQDQRDVAAAIVQRVRALNN